MLYAILCYDSEADVSAWTKEQDAAVMARLADAKQRIAAKSKFGPIARLKPTKEATTLRKSVKPVIADGPFAETKEQLLGFYVIDCATREDAHDAARRLAEASEHGKGSYEIRPIMYFQPGSRGGMS